MKIVTAVLFPLLQKIHPEIIPKRGLQKEDVFRWRSIDSNPQFLLTGWRLNHISGWISVRASIETPDPISPKLYLDFGEGYSESKAVHMTEVDLGVYQAELMLPSAPKSVRFDPTETSGDVFELQRFEIRVHSEAIHIMHQILSVTKHDFLNGTDPLRIYKKSYARYKKHQLSGMLERLEKEYKKLHPFRVQRASSRHTNYLNWIHRNERQVSAVFREEEFGILPLISIVMPTYNTPKTFLKKAIDSVIRQSYPYWELCIADDASEDEELLHILESYAKSDERVRIFYREENGGICQASNDALLLAKGEFVAFMDHDDKLPAHALLEIVKAINEKPNVQLIYTDEDKIDEKGRRYDPHFKSDWNPDMLLSQNYISHLTVIRRSLLKEVGYLRTGYEGVQDYDLLLRVAERISENEVVHIEKILYHWRAFEGSTAYDPDAKSYTTERGVKALEEHMSRKGVEAKVEQGMLPNTYKVHYPLREETLVSLIIPTRDGYDILSLCIRSILEKTTFGRYEILILDNQTTDPKTLRYFDFLRKAHTNIRIVKYDKPFNYAAINNFGVSHAKGDLICLLNNDVEVISDHWLTEMVQHALRPEIGAVGAKLYYDDDTIQHAGVILGIGGVAGHSHKYFRRAAHGYFSRLKIIQNFSAVTSACLVVRKSVYEEVGGMNEEHLKVAFNDVDFCIRVREQGYRNLWTPYVELYHHESVSRGQEDTREKKARFSREVAYMKKRWGRKLQHDPYYNSNLTLQHENFTIKGNFRGSR